MTYKEKRFQHILDLMQSRLSIIGPIQTDDAYKICSHKFGYAIIAPAFRKIMILMQEQGKAVQVGHGRWNIISKINEQT